MQQETQACSPSEMVRYSVGECANSLLMNSLSGFAMLYYTDALGLKHSLAGLAMAVAVFWDAITDPVMGHITDNTRSRFGRRHPHILVGGVSVVIIFIFLWYVPGPFTSSPETLFWYLVVVNLLQRTAITVFGVPYVALGFEMCTNYDGRVKLQGIRSAMNMVANMLGPALAWTLFFSNNDRARATSVEANYLHMGLAFAIVSLACILFVLVATRKYIRDSREMVVDRDGMRGFWRDMRGIVSDFYPRFVFLFAVTVTVGVALVSSLQMYLYEHFMRFGGGEKTIAHGGTMLAFLTGSLAGGWLARKLEKKGAVYFGAIVSISGNFLLAGVFLTGILSPGQTVTVLSATVPVALIVFVFGQAMYWLGNGIIFPTATSMIADASEIHEIKSGINRDGAYSAVFSFSQKCAISIGILISGYLLTLSGFEPGAGVVQSASTVWKLCALTLLVGPVISLMSLGLIRFYPVNRQLLEKLRADPAARPSH